MRHPDDLFSWLEHSRVDYVVLRDGHRLSGAPAPKDIDLLIDDEAIEPLWRALDRRRSGLKVDCYGLRGLHGSDYHGHSHLPESLGERILIRRRQVDGIWVPQPLDELQALLYHVTYHKCLQSGFHPDDPTLSTPGVYTERILHLEEQCGVLLTPTLESFHQYLTSVGLAVSEERLIAYLEHDFSQGRKSLFHAHLQNEHPGELNLFVIRAVALKYGKGDALLDLLGQRFRIITHKPIDFRARLTKAKHMRGGKWRRGGKPHIAVVVFDPKPHPSTPEEREVHPFVFNRNQFVKLEWRDWFCRATPARAKDNPIHSTDNEAEAFGHLPLFFTRTERGVIRERLAALRSEVPS